jgi:hypothetical protein
MNLTKPALTSALLAALAVAPASAPAATTTPPSRLGVMVTKARTAEARIASAKALGVRYARPGTVSLVNPDSEGNARASRAAGLGGVITYVARANLGQATTPPTDLRAYGTSLGRAIDRTHPVLAVIENEEDASRFYTGSATDYLRQLRTAVATAPG